MIRELLDALKNIFKWWITVTPWEQAVRVRLGKNVDLLKAGVHLRIPIADRIFLQTVRKRYTSVPTQTLTTTDGKILTVSGSFGFSISNIMALYNSMQHPEEVIQGHIQNLVTNYVITRKAEECRSRELVDFIDDNLDLSHMGIDAQGFVLTDFVITPRTYRLIQGQPKDWRDGDSLETDMEIQ